ncbi:MAG: histidine ammonia-lyase [Bacteroidetes bacterium]|nr:histidine ammonia-lyase [Bacteroidota bacterium]
MKTHHLHPSPLSLDQLADWFRPGAAFQLSDQSRQAIVRCREYLEAKLASGQDVMYGVNTGFGALCHVTISPEETAELQLNLVRSHAVGVGNPVPDPLVRGMLLLKARSLAYGHSGVRLETVQRLLDMANQDLLPVIPEQGSLGASGDLAPLAHLSLPLIGEGEVRFRGQQMPAAAALASLGWKPLELGAKEGLALINGTQFMLAYSLFGQRKAERLAALADLVAALSFEARGGRLDALDEGIQALRGHPGHALSAGRILQWLSGSPGSDMPRHQVQDNYSFRCTPQVHGASLDAMDHTRQVFTRELNAVTDNPLLFPDRDAVISGGNFHGQPLALALDYLAIAVAELGSIAERRTYRLLAGEGALPPFLTKGSGLHSGLMIPHYTAAALVSQNKQLCVPSSVDSIPSSNEQEDHVSMGGNGATKLLRVLDNTEMVLSIAFMTAAQALDLQRPGLRSSNAIENIMLLYRKRVPMLQGDRWLQPDMLATREFLSELRSLDGDEA